MQMTPGETPLERAAYWTDIIEEARAYKDGVTAFCRERELQKNNYYQWFRKLRTEHPEWVDLNNNNKSTRKNVKKKNKVVSKPVSPEVSDKAKRRTFSMAEKERILAATKGVSDAERAAILRREGVYAPQLRRWRYESKQQSLAPKKRGPEANPLTAEVRTLTAKIERLEKKLERAEKIIEVQKKISEILGIMQVDLPE